jgi:hypothetical protein
LHTPLRFFSSSPARQSPQRQAANERAKPYAAAAKARYELFWRNNLDLEYVLEMRVKGSSENYINIIPVAGGKGNKK